MNMKLVRLYEDKTGLLWIGTHDGGLICYDQSEKIFKNFSTHPKDPNTISGDSYYLFV